jgi:hypothetical protein
VTAPFRVDDENLQSAFLESDPKLSDKGLYFVSLITFAPSYNNALPFYFHTGLISLFHVEIGTVMKSLNSGPLQRSWH